MFQKNAQASSAKALVVILLMGIMWAGVSATNALAASDMLGPVVVRFSNASGDAALFIAQEKGFFAEEGLLLDITPHIPSAETIQLMVGGKLDFATINPSGGTNNAVLRGGDLVIVSAGSTTSDRSQAGIFVNAKASQTIKTLSDLKGKTINLAPGFDSTSGRSVLMLLQSVGLGAKDVNFQGWPSSQKVQEALAAGAVDIAYVIDPVATIVLDEGYGTQIGRTADVSSGSIGLLMWGRRDWVKKHEEETIRFLKAYLRGMHYFMDAYESDWTINEDAVDIVSKYTKVDPDMIKKAGLTTFGRDGRVPIEELESILTFFQSSGSIGEIADPQTYVLEQYVIEAHNRLKEEGKIQ